MNKPLLKIVVIGPNNSGKTTLITKYLYNTLEAQYFPTKNCSINRINLQQKEKKFFALEQETLEEAQTILQKSKKLLSIISNKTPLSFAVELWDIPSSFLLPKSASSIKLLQDAHGCIITIDSTNKENAIPIIGSFANLLNESWGNITSNPISLFVTKSDLYSPSIRRREIQKFAQQLLLNYSEISLVDGKLVNEKFHELIDRILMLELDRLTLNSCKVDWKFCNKEEEEKNNKQNKQISQNNLSIPIQISNNNRNSSSKVNRNSLLNITTSLKNIQLENSTEPIGGVPVYEEYVDEDDEEDLFFDDEEEEEVIEESQEEEIYLKDQKINREKRHDINSTFRSLSYFYEQLQREIENTMKDKSTSFSRSQMAKYNDLLRSCKEEYEQIKHYLNVYKISSEESSSSAGSTNYHQFQLADQIAVKFTQKKERIQKYLHSLMLAESIDQITDPTEIPDIESIYINLQSPPKNSLTYSYPVRYSPSIKYL